MEFKNTEIWGFKHALRGIRNSTNSWDKSDSGICKGGDSGIGCKNCAIQDKCNHDYDRGFKIGKKDMQLAQTSIFIDFFMKMIHVSVDVDATTYDTNYKDLRDMHLKIKNHKMREEWIETFYRWVKTLPYARELIMHEGE